MIHICKLCGSEWDDTKSKVCYQCCGLEFKPQIGEKVTFDSVADMQALQATKLTQMEALQEEVYNQREKLREAECVFQELEMKLCMVKDDEQELRNNISGIANQKKYLIQMAAEAEIKGV